MSKTRPLKLLILDDQIEWANRCAKAFKLSAGQLDVETHDKGMTGVRLAAKIKPDLIVLDSFFATTDYSHGSEILALIRKNNDLKNAFVLRVDEPEDQGPKDVSLDDCLGKTELRIDRFAIGDLITEMLTKTQDGLVTEDGPLPWEQVPAQP